MTVKDIDKGWKQLGETIRKSGNLSVTVGVHGRDKGRTDGAINNVGLAAVHEFGSPQASIPERSFVRSTVDARIADRVWTRKINKLGSAIYAGTMSVRQALEIMGLTMSRSIQRTISTSGDSASANWQDLKPATIARKASEKALIDTRELLKSVKHYVGPG